MKFNNDHLSKFYTDRVLQEMAKQVDTWIDALSDVEEAGSDTVDMLCLLSLYDCVLLLGKQFPPFHLGQKLFWHNSV